MVQEQRHGISLKHANQAIQKACKLIVKIICPSFFLPLSHLQGFEIIKAVHLDTEPFTVDNDMITPSFKLRRPQLQKRYQEAITEMYAKLKAIA